MGHEHCYLVWKSVSVGPVHHPSCRPHLGFRHLNFCPSSTTFLPTPPGLIKLQQQPAMYHANVIWQLSFIGFWQCKSLSRCRILTISEWDPTRLSHMPSRYTNNPNTENILMNWSHAELRLTTSVSIHQFTDSSHNSCRIIKISSMQSYTQYFLNTCIFTKNTSAHEWQTRATAWI